MIRGFYTAGSGLATQQKAIDNTANNIANLSTTGYKKQDLSFSDLIYNNLASEEATQSQRLKVGNGSAVAAATVSLAQGGIEHTGGALDFALRSDGFFKVQTRDGSENYTRDGSFHISSEEDGNFLVNSGGDYVLSEDGAKLKADDPELKDKIGVFAFANPYGLQKKGSNLFEATAQSGQPYSVEGNLICGSIELSNVELNSEMTDLLEIQRAYQFDSRFIQTADEIENITNNLK